MLQLSQPADVCAAGVTPQGSSIFYPVNLTEATREALNLQLRFDAATLLLQSKLKGLYVCNTDGCNSPALPACTMSTAPTCAAPVGRVIELYGPSGSSGAASMSVFGGTSSMYAGETCSGALPMALSGPRVTYRIQLPSSMPLNGSLEITTCGYTTNAADTVLAVGRGCPSSSASFRCLGANDNSALPCANSMASYIKIAANEPSRAYFVQVGAAANPASQTAGLRWRYLDYTPPTPTRTPARTRTPTRSRTRKVKKV